MGAEHPDELTLLAYVEDELIPTERGALAAHVATCPECGEHVRLLEAGRDALRDAPLLELPEERRRALLRDLPERREWSAFLKPLRSGLWKAAPALAALLLVGAFAAFATQLGGGGDDESGEGAGGGMVVQQEEAATERAVEGGDAAEAVGAPGTLARRVRGPRRQVLRELRRIGYRAVLREGAVVVTADTVEEIGVLLADRPPGAVPVTVVPP